MSETPTTKAWSGEPIVRPSLHDQVVSRLRDMIVEGTLEAGARIHESDVGRHLGVSRTPLREALKVLASEGLVDLVPTRGAVVRRLLPKDVQDMLTVLAALEELAGRLVCAVATDAQIAEVRALHDEMMAHYAARDRLAYFKLNQAIHSSFVRLTGNDVLRSIHEPMQARLKRIRFIGHEGPEKWQLAVSEHVAMIEALEARDGTRLGRVLSHHLLASWDRVRQVV